MTPSANPSDLEVEAAHRGWSVEHWSYGLRLTRAGSVLIIGAGPASEVEAIKRIAAVDSFARRWQR